MSNWFSGGGLLFQLQLELVVRPVLRVDIRVDLVWATAIVPPANSRQRNVDTRNMVLLLFL